MILLIPWMHSAISYDNVLKRGGVYVCMWGVGMWGGWLCVEASNCVIVSVSVCFLLLHEAIIDSAVGCVLHDQVDLALCSVDEVEGQTGGVQAGLAHHSHLHANHIHMDITQLKT